MSVLVLVAHPDDELLGMAGAIATARAQRRWVRVAIVTNGEQGRDERDALWRREESLDGLELLGLRRTSPRERADVFFLGHRDGTLAEAGSWRGRLRARVSRRRRSLAADVDDLLVLTDPMDVYTHVYFDGHPDHAEVSRQLLAAISRLELTVTVHATLLHPPGAGDCLELSAARWPNPADSDPRSRFTPHLDVEPPPQPACAETPHERSWGPLGPPDELIEVPSSMQAASEADNLKWQAICCHVSQLELGPISEGYLRAWVKRHEFFWTSRYVGGARVG